jgi:predicted TIM-barrel fold metal-dependent hydrolase
MRGMSAAVLVQRKGFGSALLAAKSRRRARAIAKARKKSATWAAGAPNHVTPSHKRDGNQWPGRFDARLDDCLLARLTRTPFLDSARAMLAGGLNRAYALGIDTGFAALGYSKVAVLGAPCGEIAMRPRVTNERRREISEKTATEKLANAKHWSARASLQEGDNTVEGRPRSPDRRRIARECNEYGAKLAQQHPTRFGLFCALPLPDVDATLKEIEFAFDTLKCDGAHFMTSYGDTWIGNPAYEPVMAELHRRKAVVHVHPTAANCCKNLIPGIAPGIMEYGTDTTRAIMSVMWSGQAAKFPDIRFIWSHAGGTAPFLAGRIDGASRNLKDKMPEGAIREMKKFYYDTAGAANAGAIASLFQLVSSDHVMFGTDFPPGGTSAQVAKQLAELGLNLTAADTRNIDRDNAVRLIPRLATT